jgi:hypothetical protein
VSSFWGCGFREWGGGLRSAPLHGSQRRDSEKRHVTTSKRSRRPRCPGVSSSQAWAPRRIRACLRASTASAAAAWCPNPSAPVRRRLFTSTKTRSGPRRAIRSISTRAARTLRATMRYPCASKNLAASCSPARPRLCLRFVMFIFFSGTLGSGMLGPAAGEG